MHPLRAFRIALTGAFLLRVLLFLPALRVSAAPADLDLSFGNSGRVFGKFQKVEDQSRHLADMVLQADGKIIVAGGYGSNSLVEYYSSYSLVRYHPNGTLDASFGTDGRVDGDFDTSGVDFVDSLVVQENGLIVISGQCLYESGGGRFALARFDPRGNPDVTFGDAGRVLLPVDDPLRIAHIAAQTDGKIVAVGGLYGAFSSDLAVVRFNIDGSLDRAFGNRGRASIDFGFFPKDTAPEYCSSRMERSSPPEPTTT